jgi:outer membrane receptor for ferric coprogen and ferric-rhodotorulic acid
MQIKFKVLALVVAAHSSQLLAQSVAQSSNLLLEAEKKAIPDSSASTDSHALTKQVVTGTQQQGFSARENSTATKLDLSLRHTPQSVSIISSDLLKAFQLDDINQALALTPGIQVEKPETDRIYYSSRGFDITQFQLDGMGMPLSNNNIYGDIDTAMFERIEVLRGANGLTAGAGNPSATINFVRKRPTEELEANVTASVGSWNKARLVGDVSGAISDNVRGRAVLVKEDKESYLDRYEQDKALGYGVLEIDLTDRTLLTLGHSTQSNKTNGALWGALPLTYSDGTATNYDRSTSSAADWSYFDTTEQRSFAEVSQVLNNGWSIQGSLNYVELETDSYLFYVAGNPSPVDQSGVLAAYASEYDLNEWQSMAEVYASGPFQAFGQVHELVVGSSYSKVKVFQNSLYDATTVAGFSDPTALTQIDLTTFDGNYPAPVFNIPGGGGAWEETEKAVYATGKFQVSESNLIIAGARASKWVSKGEAYGSDRGSDDSIVLPYLGLIHDLNDQLSTYVSYTETFLPQSEMDASLERLAPKTGRNFELGLKAEFSSLNATVAAFSTAQDNVATFSETINAVDVYTGEDGITSQGIELDLAGKIGDNTSISTGGTILSIQDANGQKTNLYTPEKTANLAVSYQLAPSLKMGAIADWQSSITGSVKQDAYTLLGAMVSYDISSSLNTQLVVNNITDEKYLTSLKWAQGYYGAPRSVIASLSWDL